MQEITISVAGDKDLAVVYFLIEKLARHLSKPFTSNMKDLQNLLFSKDSLIQTYLIFDEEKPIGLIIVYEIISTFLGKKILRIEDVYLEPEYRGNGVGEMILKFLIDVAKQNDCHHLDGMTTQSNIGMHYFVEKNKGYFQKNWLRFIIPI